MAATNLVRLPTAASRKVDNHRWAEQRKAGKRAKAESRMADRYIRPEVRRMLPTAERYYDLMPTPELAVAMAVFHALPFDIQAAAVARMDAMAERGSVAHLGARAVIDVERWMRGDERIGVSGWALSEAIQRVAEERGLRK